MHWWNAEEIEYLRQHYPNHPQKELLEMFNEHFNVAIGDKQLVGALKRYNITSGRTGRFEKDQPAWNKNMKGVNFGGENGKKTQFKAGNKPLNYRPVGSERINVDGYIEVKVADPNKWKLKQRVVWEEANGPIPKGHAILFGDGNSLNVSIDNLILVSRKQLATLNKHNLIQDHVELTKAGIIVADIYLKIGERKKANK